MFILIAAAAAAAAPPVANVGYAELMRGDDAAAIAVITETQGADTDHPAALINLGVASARRGDVELARHYFQAVIKSREIVELETSTGEWVDTRTLGRRALAMLESGAFARGSILARN